MRNRLWLPCASAGVILAITASTGLLAEGFSNAKVVVTKSAIVPGKSEALAVQHPSVVVYFDGQSEETILANGSRHREEITRGKTVREPAETGTLLNTGSTPLVFVRVEFLTAGGQETWGTTGLAPSYKVLFEDQHSRTYDIRIPAHAREPQHTHHDRVVICLSGATLEHILPDGRKQPSTLKTGEIAWRQGQTHIGHNMGNTDLWVIAIEPK
ncbi:MAG TPA: hypothetical protein VL991_04950 [Terracidiphilus sp.]|nr:hypothetical protein [Terracidiphilus sp.]